MMKIDGISVNDLEDCTNILEVVVPKEMERTVPTGIEFVDHVFGGAGMTPSSVTLFTGEPGTGKTTLALQIADSWTEQGNVCLFNTTEESLIQVRRTTQRLNLRNGFFCGQDRLIPDVVKHMRKISDDHLGLKRSLLIIDSLQSHDDGKYANGGTNSMTQVRVAEQIASFCKETFSMAIIIGQVTKSGEFAGKQQIKHTVDIHTHMRIDRTPNSETRGERIYTAKKNRFGPAGVSFVLGMEPSRGLFEKGYHGEGDF